MSENLEGSSQPGQYKGPSSPRLDILKQYKPDLFNPDEDGICTRAPANFVATLQIATLQPQIRSIFADTGVSVPYYLTNPYMVASVPLAYYDQEKMDAVDLGESAPVLIKQNVYANHIGLCRNGDYSGLIVMPFERKLTDRVIIRRLWNDGAIRIPEKHILRAGHDIRPENRPVWERIKAELGRLFEERFNDRFKKKTSITEAFFELCEELNIPVDRSNFHYIP